MKRLNPLNDYLFLKIMGEKGDEEQLLGFLYFSRASGAVNQRASRSEDLFLNAVLKRPKDEQLKTIEIVENRALSADIIGAKASVLDVRAILENGDRVDKGLKTTPTRRLALAYQS